MTHRNATLTLNERLKDKMDSLTLMLAEEIMFLLEEERDGRKLCVIGRPLVDLAEPYRSALQKIVDLSWSDGGLTEFGVAQVMNEAGLPGSPTSVLRHRRGLCICQKKDTTWTRTP